MSTNNGDDWCLIESDPGVFTELLESLGCDSVELQELWSLDDESLLTAVTYGLVFLFQWDAQNQSSHASNVDTDIPDGMWFGRQVATNACATQAILSILLNQNDVQLGKTLTEFRDFTKDFSAQIKGVSIASSEELRSAHNAFANPDTLFDDDRKPKPNDTKAEAFHFVAYIPYKGVVYELDGLMPGPIAVGEIPSDDTSPTPAWIAIAKAAIQTRMGNLQTEKFNLMAVIQDKRKTTKDPEELAMEEQKRVLWKRENERRRHNYIPLIVQLLKEFAKQDQLTKLVDDAKERKRAKFLPTKTKVAEDGKMEE